MPADERPIAVFDANVLVSAFLSQHGAPGQSLDLCHSGRARLVTSEAILAKVTEIFNRRWFLDRVPGHDVETYVRRLRGLTEIVLPDVTISGLAPDAEDDIVLATAVAAEADYLVTGDHAFLAIPDSAGITIIPPQVFLALLDT